jgi:hypothetical protein
MTMKNKLKSLFSLSLLYSLTCLDCSLMCGDFPFGLPSTGRDPIALAAFGQLLSQIPGPLVAEDGVISQAQARREAEQRAQERREAEARRARGAQEAEEQVRLAAERARAEEERAREQREAEERERLAAEARRAQERREAEARRAREAQEAEEQVRLAAEQRERERREAEAENARRARVRIPEGRGDDIAGMRVEREDEQEPGINGNRVADDVRTFWNKKTLLVTAAGCVVSAVLYWLLTNRRVPSPLHCPTGN